MINLLEKIRKRLPIKEVQAYLPCIKVETLDGEERIQLTWNNDSTSDSPDIPQMHLKLTNIGNAKY